MTLTINIPPDVQRVLEEKARQAGQTVPEFASTILAEVARMNHGLDSSDQLGDVAQRLAALQRIGAYDTRVRAGLAPLSDQDISRERIYEGE
jgi:hypothetical protein